MSSKRQLGPFTACFPEGWVNPAHERQAIGLLIPKDRLIQVRTETGVDVMLACSRAEWMAFVAAVKAGRADTRVPDDR